MILNLLIFIVTLLVLVVIHELGHFLAARKFNIKVEEFGFGIPPRVFGKKFGETLFSLNLLPLGGFVKLLGEDEVDKKALENKRSFAAQTVGKRITVAIAGVVMNLILAWILFYVFLAGKGFKIELPMIIEHQFIGANQTVESLVAIGSVAENSPAKEAGIKEGERILAVNNQPIKDGSDFSSKVKGLTGQEIEMTLSDLNKNNIRNVVVTSRKDPPPGQGAIGISFGEAKTALIEYQSLEQKLLSGITYSVNFTQLTFKGLGRTISDISNKNFERASQTVSGPVGLAIITNDILKIGDVLQYLHFMGLISLTLAIFNFLPIPALDGGRLLFFYVEALFGKRALKPELEAQIHTIGFMVLMALMILVFYSDIRNVCMFRLTWC